MEPASQKRQVREGRRLSIVIPVLNDADALQRLLGRLATALRERSASGIVEVIVADGGSVDRSVAVAAAGGARVVSSCAGRGRQLAAAIAESGGVWLWMLHADSEPSREAVAHLLARPTGAPGWGRFSVSLEPGTALEVIAAAMNLRSRLTGICTGDQGIFVHRAWLEATGGMPLQPLMEDIELSRRLKRCGWPECRPEGIGASPRRWRRHGPVRTVLSMWHYRLRYWSGTDAEVLAREYYRR